MTTVFHVPTRPFGLIAAINRRAAAIGSCRTAELTAHADYNGHFVAVRWNSYRRYYTTEYTWAGRVVLARGSAIECIRAALREYDRGALGAAVHIVLEDGDDLELPADITSRITLGTEPRGEPNWYDGWIEWSLRNHCDHLIIQINSLPDMTDKQRVDMLLKRGLAG